LAEGELAGLLGSFIPFAKTKAARRKSGDPRLSLEERYVNKADYLQRLGRAARILVEQRYLLPEDAARMMTATTYPEYKFADGSRSVSRLRPRASCLFLSIKLLDNPPLSSSAMKLESTNSLGS
jgi:hypothetical protein